MDLHTTEYHKKLKKNTTLITVCSSVEYIWNLSSNHLHVTVFYYHFTFVQTDKIDFATEIIA
jgi:hypothetical protein